MQHRARVIEPLEKRARIVCNIPRTLKSWKSSRRKRHKGRGSEEDGKDVGGSSRTRERRFKSGEEGVAFKKRKEYGEPVAASARQLRAQLQPGAVTSTMLRGKPSQFAKR
ncbi:hypothetical protein HZH68_009880 [Vespula germanica]|uniref:Uncharacterized protein n=1 Tax=Vespula germanica TaxID=30212 RepID=A0A834JX98_VESGE|nr:hypothetical protein HZH68_009880 [Vespula germanica]